MGPERLRRVRALFDAAVERPAGERRGFVEQAAAADESLRDEVLALLADQEAAKGFLSGSVLVPDSLGANAPEPSAPSLAGRQIGAYRLLDEIGHGGMGTVYRAARADDAFQKTVALKLVRGGAASDLTQQRFRRERQILGKLQHPNIATVFDGGTTAEGQPYLVMEHVEGEPIDRYCARRELPVRQRLEMFRQVCAAVHYAHQNLVVHRDLKPGNILVTAEGTPKLLDFGIAKLLAAGLDPEEAPTATMLPMMTPEYASPEQVKGEAVTTASDVYSLGIVLYELLTGRRPYVVRTDSLEEIVRAVCGTEPQSPSTALRDTSAGMTRAPVTVSDLRGDLDTIVLKALRKEPARRYASVQELSEDLRRHLDGRPVRARPDTVRYRASKFVARNRAGVAAAVAVVLALVGGLVAAARQARIAGRERAVAERRFQDVRRLANSLIFELHDKIRYLVGATEAKKLLVQRASEYLDLLAAEAPGDAALAEDLATAHERLSATMEGPDYVSVGDDTGAWAHLMKATSIRERLAAERPADLDRQRLLALDLQNLVYLDSDLAPGLEHGRRAVEIADRLVAAEPSRAAFQQAAAGAHYAAATAFVEAADWPAALSHFRAAADGYDRQLALSPGDANALRSRALCDKRMGGLLVRSARWAEAAERYRRALQVEEARAAAAPNEVMARRDVSVTRVDLSLVHWNLGDVRQAVADISEALRIREDLARGDPKNVAAQRDLASARHQYGWLLVRQGKAEESVRVLDAAEALGAGLPRNAQHVMVDILATRGEAAALSGDRASTVAYARRAFELNDSLLRESPNPTRQARYAELALALGDGLGGVGRCGDARRVYQSGLEQAVDLERGKKLIGDKVHLPERLRAGLAGCDRSLKARTGSERLR